MIYVSSIATVRKILTLWSPQNVLRYWLTLVVSVTNYGITQNLILPTVSRIGNYKRKSGLFHSYSILVAVLPHTYLCWNLPEKFLVYNLGGLCLYSALLFVRKSNFSYFITSLPLTSKHITTSNERNMISMIRQYITSNERLCTISIVL